MRTRALGGLFLVLALILSGAVLAYNSRARQQPIVFSDREMLANTWDDYKLAYLEPGTSRTLDKQRDNVTTSEGQGYTMMRAAWQSDKPAFDASWQWTRDNLKRPNDALFSWLFGRTSSGQYGIIDAQGGRNTASDGDVDIAFALLQAYGRWGDKAYLDSARDIVSDIWKLDVVEEGGRHVLAANDLERLDPNKAILNPSYFSPYAFRIFAQVDPDHDWRSLVDGSYYYLNASLDAKIGDGKAVLPPDWVQVDKPTDTLVAVPDGRLPTTYGYDAMRTVWRVALDYQWSQDPRAKSFLERLSKLGDDYAANGKIAAVYSRTGAVIGSEEAPASYGANIGYFLVARPDLAPSVYRDKLKVLYSASKTGWQTPLSYYDDNWAWLGLALATDQTPNLTGL